MEFEWNVSAYRIAKIADMPKLYLGPGLSRRVHQALSRRLEQFMAANAEVPAPREELPLTENPPLPANAGAADTESEKGEEHGNHPPEEVNKSPAEREDRDDDRSRSPRLRVPEPDPNSTAASLLRPLPWPSGSPVWSVHSKVRAKSWKSLSSSRRIFRKISAGA